MPSTPSIVHLTTDHTCATGGRAHLPAKTTTKQKLDVLSYCCWLHL